MGVSCLISSRDYSRYLRLFGTPFAAFKCPNQFFYKRTFDCLIGTAAHKSRALSATVPCSAAKTDEIHSASNQRNNLRQANRSSNPEFEPRGMGKSCKCSRILQRIEIVIALARMFLICVD